jgi:ribosomal protein S18 acetylase RimI-like enzyme
VSGRIVAANFADYLQYLPSRLVESAVSNRDALVIRGATQSASFNVVARARFDVETASARIDEIAQLFRSGDQPYSWWVGPTDTPADLEQRLVDAGLRAEESDTAMVALIEDITAPSSPALGVVPVLTPPGVREFGGFLAEVTGDPAFTRFYERAASVLVEPGCPFRIYLGRCDGKTVCCASTFASGDAVGIYNVATLRRHRRRGFAAAITASALLDTARQEPTARVGVLQASQAAAGTFRWLGFELCGTFTVFTDAQIGTESSQS